MANYFWGYSYKHAWGTGVDKKEALAESRKSNSSIAVILANEALWHEKVEEKEIKYSSMSITNDISPISMFCGGHT